MKRKRRVRGNTLTSVVTSEARLTVMARFREIRTMVDGG
jgi:hypothetical protein